METPTQTPILTQLESLRGLALDPNNDIESLQLQLAALIVRLKSRMDGPRLRTFLRFEAERAAHEAAVGRYRVARLWSPAENDVTMPPGGQFPFSPSLRKLTERDAVGIGGGFGGVDTPAVLTETLMADEKQCVLYGAEHAGPACPFSVASWHDAGPVSVFDDTEEL
jgi:hypothetical protein